MAWAVSPAYRELLADMRKLTTTSEHNERLAKRWQTIAEGAANDRRRALDGEQAALLAIEGLSDQLREANAAYDDLAADLRNADGTGDQRTVLLREIVQLRTATGCLCKIPTTASTSVMQATIYTLEEMLAHYEGRPHGQTTVCAGDCSKALV
jgi:hypothetical protein